MDKFCEHCGRPIDPRIGRCSYCREGVPINKTDFSPPTDDFDYAYSEDIYRVSAFNDEYDNDDIYPDNVSRTHSSKKKDNHGKKKARKHTDARDSHRRQRNKKENAAKKNNRSHTRRENDHAPHDRFSERTTSRNRSGSGATASASYGSGVFTSILATLLAIILFAVSLSALTVFQIRYSLTREGIAAMLDRQDYSVFLQNLDDGKRASLDRFYGRMADEYNIPDMDDEKLVQFIEDSDIKERLAEKLAPFARDIRFGDGELVFEAGELTDMITANRATVRDIFGIDADTDTAGLIAQGILRGDSYLVCSVDELADASPVPFALVRLSASYITLGVLVIAGFLIAALMMCCGVCNGFSGCGASLLLSGAVVASVTVTAWLSPDLIGRAVLDNRVIGRCIEASLIRGFTVTLAVAGVGLLMLLIRALFLRKNR